MTRGRLTVAVTCVLLAALAAFLLRSGDTGRPEGSLPSVSSVMDAKKVDGEIARTPAGPITETDVRRRLTLMTAQYGKPDCTPGSAKCRRIAAANHMAAANSSIISAWLGLEARRRGVTVTARDIRKVRAGMPAAQVQLLRRMTSAQVTELLRDIALDEKLFGPASAGAPSQARLRKVYEQNKLNYQRPEQRNVLIHKARTRSRADAARRMMRNGATWQETVKRYGDDVGVLATGGRQLALPASDLPGAVAKAVFASANGSLVGPIRADGYWWQVKTTDIQPKVDISFQQARKQLSDAVRSTDLTTGRARWMRRWRDRTRCETQLKLENCSDGPLPEILKYVR